MRRALPVLLLLCLPAPAAAQAPERIGYPRGAAGPGTVVRYEEKGREPRVLVVIGEVDWQTARTLREVPRLVLVERGDRPPYGEFWLLHWGLAEPGVRVVRLVPGELRGVVPNVGGRE